MTSQVTMTTVEIAKLTGKAHKNVLADARRIIEQIGELKSQPSSFTEATYLSAQKKTLPMLVLNKHLTFTLITGYDSGLRHTVLGRWIELEALANPGFLSQTVTETLNDLQARVDAMTPSYSEHVRRGTTGRGYLWDEACRMAEVPAKATKEFFRERHTFVYERPAVETVDGGRGPLVPRKEGFAKGYFKRSTHTVKHGGHPDGFKVTLKGLEWLKGFRDAILAWDAERRKVRAVTDADGFVVDIKGEGAQGMTTADLRKEVTQ
ncbi:Rha family transcriptional regulator [Pseudomonas monteilii]|uniref:Rha family transcriptional regulator n=1 Tax=Pseudomonas monteilii TaxID=76759 RepID=UPI001E29F5F0|nr:Rha family transcriptional regulator [Pseudomonas monteilii]MCE1009976.1 phage regulatory protein/antirepressor Ant [Pseudomonas monteilii]